MKFRIRLFTLILSLAMVLAMMPAVSYGETGYKLILSQTDLYKAMPYLVNGSASATGTLGQGGCTAHYDPETNVLELWNYEGSFIDCPNGGDMAFTIILHGTNKITTDARCYGVINESSKNMYITSTDNGSLTVAAKSTSDESHVNQGYGVLNQSGNLEIRGSASVTVTASSNTGKAFGIACQHGGITVKDSASASATCHTKIETAYGLYAFGGASTFNTSGSVYADCTDSGTGDSYAIGNDRALTIDHVGKMELKANPNTYRGRAVNNYTAFQYSTQYSADDYRVTGGPSERAMKLVYSKAAISVSPDGKTFTNVKEGYTSLTPQTFTITSTGTYDVSSLTASLAGADPEAFTVTQPAPTSLNKAGGAVTASAFTVTPKAGLSAGTYTADLIVDSENLPNKNIVTKTLSFKVDSYKASLMPESAYFSDMTVGYDINQVSPKEFTLTNTGNADLTNVAVSLGGTNADSFSLDKAGVGTTLAAGASVTFSLKPNAGLAAGNYSADVTVTADNLAAMPRNVSFTVRAADAPSAVCVYVDSNEKTLDSTTPYLVGGEPASGGALGTDGCTAYYDGSSGTLKLQGYNYGSIVQAGNNSGETLTIELIGSDNTITTTNLGGIQSNFGTDVVIKGSGSLLISAESSDTARGILLSNSGVTIEGSAQVTINSKTTSTTGAQVYGIDSKTRVDVLDNAGLSITLHNATDWSSYGIISNGTIRIDTAGAVTVDCADTHSGNCVHATSSINLNNVSIMTLKKGTTSSDYYIYPDISETSPNFAVMTDKTARTQTYRYGTPRTLTVTGGSGSGQYLAEDTVTVTADTPAAYHGFKEWQVVSGTAAFADKNSSSTTFTMPAADVSLKAVYKETMFTVQPVSASAPAGTDITVNWTLKETPLELSVIHTDSNGNTYTVESLSTSATSYTFKSDGTVKSQTYKIETKVNGENDTFVYYYSDPFTVTWNDSYTASLSPLKASSDDPFTFSGRVAGYTSSPSQTFTLTNTGTGLLQNVAVTMEGSASDFDLGLDGMSTVLNNSQGPVPSTVFTVAPKSGLAAGDHIGVIKITADGMDPIMCHLSFKVYASGSVSITGTVTSYSSASDVLTKLYPSTTADAAIRTNMKAGGSDALGYTSSVGTATGSAPTYARTYTISNVIAGEYKLAVYEPGHGIRITVVTVGTENITGKNVTLYKMGDVNGNAAVDISDMQRLYEHLNGSNVLTDTEIGDVNGNGAVDISDMQRLYEHLNGSNPLT